MTKPLKLKCDDSESLALMAALLQDAAVVKSDLHYDADGHYFVLLGNRYCWEAKRPWWQRGILAKKFPGERVRTALHFNGVLAVQKQGLDDLADDTVLDLLHMDFSPESGDKDDLGGHLTLTFAAHVSVRLTLECIEIFMTDQGEPFEALVRPDH